jgi:hypothetical protein
MSADTDAAIIEAKLLEFLDRDEYTPLSQQAQELASALADARRADVEVVRVALDAKWVGKTAAHANESARQRALAALSRLAGET